MPLPCVNCKNLVEPDTAKIFAGVFVCTTCHLVAERQEARIFAQLKTMTTFLREKIRLDLVQGQLHLGPAEALKDPSKKEVLEQITKILEMQDAHKTRPGSSNPSQQPVRAVGNRANVRNVGDTRGGGTPSRSLDIPGDNTPGDPMDSGPDAS